MSEFYEISDKFVDYLLSDAVFKDDEFDKENLIVEFGGEPYLIGFAAKTRSKKEALKQAGEWLRQLPVSFGLEHLEPRKLNKKAKA